VRARLNRLLEHPRLPWLAVGLAVLLCLPALGSGLCSDDFVHRAVLRGSGPFPAAEHPLLDLFAFVSPSAPHAKQWQDLGFFPWFADPQLSIAFLRPLAAASHLLDMRAWPDAVVLHHAHSLIWLALAVGLAALLYRRVGGPGAAMGLATLLFAVEDAHALPAAWLANRNALLALSFGVLGLLTHLRWRRTGRVRDLLLAVVAMAAALLCGEAALGALAYLVAWQLCLDGGRWRARLLPIAPYAALVLAWRGTYEAMGYGVRASGLYIDPGHQPLDFARALIERGPLLLAGQWLQAPLDAWVVLPPERRAVAAVAGVAVVLGLAALMLPLLLRSRQARFWALGMALSTVPLCATFPMDRLLIFTGLGAAPLLALMVRDQGWLDAPARASGLRLRRGVLALLLVLHLPIAALLLSVKGATAMQVFVPARALEEHFGGVEDLEERTVVLVNGHDLLGLTMVYTFSETMGRTPRRLLQLGSVMTPLEVTRTDERTLELRQARGLLSMAFDTLMRDPGRGFAVGERIERPDATVELLELTPEGLPLRWRVRFAQPLEDPGYHFARMVWGGAEAWPLPAVGQTVRLTLAAHRITAPGEPIEDDEGLH
jgi:hypothetical protein